MNLRTALRVDKPESIAFVGAGGKTTSMFRLAYELPHPVIVTTTTHLGAWQVGHGDRWLIGLSELEKLTAFDSGVTVITGQPGKDDRLGQLSPDELGHLHHLASERGWSVLIEADGARQLPLKAPAEHEPAIPSWVDKVVVVAGLSGLNSPCNNAYIHRPDVFAQLAQLSPGERVGEDHLVRMLMHPSGGLKGIPIGVKKIILLNQADDANKAGTASRMTQSLIGGYTSALVGSMLNDPENEILLSKERIAGIILAAGASSRFGKPKQDLLWRGKSFLENVIQIANEAGLAQVLVILNNAHSQLIYQTDSPNLCFIENKGWQTGQSSSIRLGIKSLGSDISGAVFLLCDQPHIPSTLLRAMLAEHAITHSPIVAPLVAGKRGNPVLFDCTTFADLLQLEGDKGGRTLFSKYPVHYIPWQDESILLDVDTPEDYSRLLELE